MFWDGILAVSIFLVLYLSLVKHKLKPSAGLLILFSYLLLSLVALIPGCFGRENRMDGPIIEIPPNDSVAVSVKELNDPSPGGAAFEVYLCTVFRR